MVVEREGHKDERGRPAAAAPRGRPAHQAERRRRRARHTSAGTASASERRVAGSGTACGVTRVAPVALRYPRPESEKKPTVASARICPIAGLRSPGPLSKITTGDSERSSRKTVRPARLVAVKLASTTRAMAGASRRRAPSEILVFKVEILKV